MCQFITAALPPGARENLPPALLQKYGLAFTPLDNPHALSQLPPGWTWHHATGAYCDCNSALGSLAGVPDGKAPEEEFARLARRGWSEARVRRWQEERQRRSEATEQRGIEIANWTGFLRAALKLPGVDAVGVLLHTYSGTLTGERVPLGERVTVDAGELMAGRLLELKQDVLYLFRSETPHHR